MTTENANARSEAGAMKGVGKRLDVPMLYEPTLSVQFLPRCPHCEAPHPHARRPALHIDHCPDCGSAIATAAEPITVPAVITGGGASGVLARLCFAIARGLAALARRL